jgi:hypothetical protein
VKRIETTQKSLRRWLQAGHIALAALLYLLSPAARADMLLLGNTTLVTGTESATYSFTAPGPGTVTAELTNLDWPQTLSSLSFMASSQGQVLASLSDPSQLTALTSTQAMTFQVGHAGTYFANVTATPGSPLGIGVYSLSLHFSNGSSAVPLPSSGWLLAGALALIFGFLWRRRAADAAQTPEGALRHAAGCGCGYI